MGVMGLSLQHGVRSEAEAERAIEKVSKRIAPALPFVAKARTYGECGSGLCEATWAHRFLLKSKSRPVFEGKWSCSKECLRSMVAASVWRAASTPVARREQHQHRMPLGLMMLSHGMITREQLQHALEAQRTAGSGRIGEWLVHTCGVREATVTKALGLQWGCQVLPVAGVQTEAMARVVPRALLEMTRVTPLHIYRGRKLYLAFEDGLDAAMALAVQRMSGLQVENGVAEAEPLRVARERLMEAEFVASTNERVADLKQLIMRVAACVYRKQPVAARMVRVHDRYWLRLWLEEGAMTDGSAGVPHSCEDVEDVLYMVG